MRNNNYLADAEECNAIAVITMGHEQARELCMMLRPEYFADPLRRLCFEAAKELYEAGKQVKFSTIVARMKEIRPLKHGEAGALMTYDYQGVEKYTHSANYKYISETLHRCYVNREAQKAVMFYTEQLELFDPYKASIELINTIDQLRNTIEYDDFSLISEKALDVSEKIRQIAAGEFVEDHCKTFIPSLDKMIGGFYPKQYITLAARPGQGKSLLALQIALNQASKRLPVAYITLEMSTEEQVLRCLANRTKIPTKRMKAAKYLEPNELSKIQEQSVMFDKMPLYFNDDATIDTIKIESYVRELKKKGVKGIFIDMIQLLQPMTGDKAKGKTEQITNISKALKAIAKRNDIWIVNIAAMNRDADKGNRPPKISDIRESGQIESDSDVVMMLYRPNYDPNQPPSENSEEEIQLIIGKNREGGTGSVNLLAKWHICEFTELANMRSNFEEPKAPF
jgi:replicative DNA helicase